MELFIGNTGADGLYYVPMLGYTDEQLNDARLRAHICGDIGDRRGVSILIDGPTLRGPRDEVDAVLAALVNNF